MRDTRIDELIERALDFRGFVTLSRHDSTQLVGFMYDRGAQHVELFDGDSTERVRVAIADIADIAIDGEDAAAKAQAIWERRRGALEPSETPIWGDWADHATLLVVALPLELRAVRNVIGAKGPMTAGRFGDHRAIGLAVGVGGGTARAIAEHQPRLVISCGFSGALDPTLRAGDIVLATSVCDDNRDSISVDDTVLRSARHALDGVQRVREGEIVCTVRVAATSDEKRALVRRGRLAVDLESWAAAHAAKKAGIPWLGLRVVLDPMHADLPAFTRDLHASYVWPAVRHALRGPRAMLELARVGLRARIALSSLERALLRIARSVGSLRS